MGRGGVAVVHRDRGPGHPHAGLPKRAQLHRRRRRGGFDGFGIGKELHYYKEQKMQLQVHAAGALLHDWAKEQAAIQRLIDEGRVVLL